MDNFEDLSLRIEKFIEEEKDRNPDIKYLNKTHAKLITQIISNYKLSEKNDSENIPTAKMIFLGAPTGAGKDTLVRKIKKDNQDENFIDLNMDIFRHYHNEISDMPEDIKDKDFAIKTNQTSYELYYIIQEIILREFPGTNIIVTGTMKDLEWVKAIVSRYKKDKKTKYSTSLYTLAVPPNESAFSIFERYLNMVDTRGNSKAPLRYTDLSYHSETIKNFIANVIAFESDLRQNSENSLFDAIRVYRRGENIFNDNEDTLIYDSDNRDLENSAGLCIHKIMDSNPQIDGKRIVQLLDIIKRNSDYLTSQDLYVDILINLQKILPQLNRSKGDSSVGK